MDELMQMACQAGKILLESGAETYRVEETMVKICEAYGAKEANSFVLPTGIFLSITQDQKTLTKVTRVKSRSLDLNKVDYINGLSRRAVAKELTQEEFEISMREIDGLPRYSVPVTLFCAALCGGGFVLFYQGSWRDAVAAFFCTFMVKAAVMLLDRYGINVFLNNAIGGGIATAMALFFVSIGIGQNMNAIVSSTIMILVPGLAITNAIRDGIAGDLVSGMTKAAEACIVAIFIALGTGAVLALWLALGGGMG